SDRTGRGRLHGDRARQRHRRRSMSRSGAGSVATTIVVDLGAGEAEARRRASVADGTLRACGVEPTIRTVPDAGAVSGASAATAGRGFPVILGDDRSIRAAIAAVMSGRGRRVGDPRLGVLAAHAQVDFVRTFGIPGDRPAFATERLLTAPPYPIDVAE